MRSRNSARILFILTREYIPQRLAGVERCTHEICIEFAREGFQPMVAARLKPQGATWYLSRIRAKLTGSSFPSSTGLGYPVHRGYDPENHLDEILELTRPDCVVVLGPECGPVVEQTESCGIPVFVYFHDAEFQILSGNPSEWTWARFIANSSFTQSFYARKYGIESTVVYPLIRPEGIASEPSGDFVLFINPVPVKGVDTAFRLAEQLPKFKFLFQESWALAREPLAALRQRTKGLPNVTFQRVTKDRRRFFGKAKILIVPSLCEEAFGRVAVEAQMSGIPVVASNRGGLPEAVGSGGVVISDPENVDEWVPAIERLMTDREHYRELSDAARRNVIRPEFSRDHIVESLIGILTGRD